MLILIYQKNMNKYVYAEATQDFWPQLRTIMAPSYREAVDKVIESYSDEFPDKDFSSVENWENLHEFLNASVDIDLSDLKDVEEL